MTQTLQHFLGSLGVWSIFWFSAIGPYVFPAAGEIAILLGAATRAYPMPAIVILATAGGVASDHAAYWFGRRAASPLVARFLRPDRRLILERRIKQDAPLWLVLGRLVTALRTYLAITAGIGKFHYGWFTLYNLVGCVLWAIAFTALGYFLGAHIDARSLVTTLGRYSLAIIGVVIAIYVGLFLLRRFRTRKLH